MSPRHVKMSGRHVALSETHFGIFSGKMSERHVKMFGRHVKMSGRHLGMIFSQGLWGTCQDAWETSWDFCPARCLGDMLRCLEDILAFFQARCLRGMLRFLMQTPRHCFQKDLLRCLGDIVSRKILRDMFRCLRDILAFFSGKMAVRNVKILPCLWGILLFVQAKCLRDMSRCQGEMSRLLGDIFFSERHRASNFQQFPGETA